MRTSVLQKSLSIICTPLLMSINTAHSAPADGKMTNPKVKGNKMIIRGGSNFTSKWVAPEISTFKVWGQVPSGSTASNVKYYVYPKGNSVGNTTCSITDTNYPCFTVMVNQTTAINGWVQLTLNNDPDTAWTFSSVGYVAVKGKEISSKTQLGVAQVSFESITLTAPIDIGQTYQGGKIFYLDSAKQHGLIAATQDTPSLNAPWWNGSYALKTATGAVIGTGQANTTAIVNAQGESAFGPGSSYAAKWCDDLVLGGYSDWYLPSKDELNQLYINRNSVGDFVDGGYWSSTNEYDPKAGQYTGAWGQIFNSVGTQYPDALAGGYKVRCVRTF